MDIMFVLYFIVPVILGAVILLVGIIILFVDSHRKKKAGAVETSDWGTTGGKITSAHLEQHEERKDDASGTHIDIGYEPVVEYVYTVDGQEYRSNNVFPGENIYFSKSNAQEILDEHPINKYVPVSYDPDDPATSSLEPRPEGVNYFHLIGLVLTSFGVLVCCFTSFMAFILIGKIL